MKTTSLIAAFLLALTIKAAEFPAAVTNELSFKITYHSLHLGYVKAVKQANDAIHSYTISGKAEGDLFLGKIVSENCIHHI